MLTDSDSFIKDEIFILTIQGAFARNIIYKSNVSDVVKKDFRINIQRILNDISIKYLNKKYDRKNESE